MQAAHKLGDIHYWTSHDNAKKTAIFIHGFTGSHEGFQYLIPKLPWLRCIVPDVPGFGESKLHDDHQSLDAIAKKLNDFVRDLQLEKPPILISHSMGTLVAASMLEQSPELFAKKTVFISPVASKIGIFDKRKAGELAGRWQYFLGMRIPVAGPKLVKSRLVSRIATKLLISTKDPELRKAIYEHHFKNLDFISSTKLYYKLHREINKRGVLDHANKLRTFDAKIITGDKDPVAPHVDGKKLAKAIDAELHTIENVGHLAHYETPEEIAKALTSFLR